MKIGETIRCFRFANNYYTKEVAEKTEVSSTFVSEVENGNKIPSLKSLRKFAYCFNVTTSTILKICEQAEEENWNFQKTLLETLKIYVGD